MSAHSSKFESYITQNEFLNISGDSALSPDSTLIYFIPGNPGLLGYYQLFLSLLSSNLTSEQDSTSDVLEPTRVDSRTYPPPPLASDYNIRTETKRKRENNENNEQGEDRPSHASHNEFNFVVRGRSLGGFEVPEAKDATSIGEKTRAKRRKTGEKTAKKQLYDLNEEIAFMERDFETFAQDWREAVQEKHGMQQKPRARVIMIGHSVGTYITMEIMRRRREKIKIGDKMHFDTRPSSHESEVDGEWTEEDDRRLYNYDDGIDVIGGIMLFPTVVDIAKSPSGRILTMLQNIPYLPLTASLLARILVSILPHSVLSRVVSCVMKSPRKEAVDVTIAMLRNPSIIRQALHLAEDEMRNIGADKWTDEIWGLRGTSEVSNQQSNRLAKLIFYFGRDDHWVAEQTREEIIRSRKPKTTPDGLRGHGPMMMVCDDGIMHGFCIGHNELMAKKTGRFIRNILKANSDRDTI
ncbi:hypothetical protein FQN57_005235 [Myotisia sp. PD_48]|nr:hypothetical protein FQN57_005235 [Myotisia sp. PD_48]